MNQVYFCWVTVLLSSFQDDIVAGLVKRGYVVGPASKDGQILSGPGDAPAGTVIALSVYKRAGTISSQQIHDDVCNIMNDINGWYYSIIVAENGESSWVGANFQLTIKPHASSPPITPPPLPDKNLN